MIRWMTLALLIPAVSVAQSATDLASARAEITPLLREMQTAANAHDTDRHVAFYAHESSVQQ
jgi:hypothetical protein